MNLGTNSKLSFLSLLALGILLASSLTGALALVPASKIVMRPGMFPPVVATNPQQCANETIYGKVGLAEEIVQIYSGISLPSLNGPPGVQNGEVNPYALYDCEPAPMGIADFGVGSNGPYDYGTNSSLGILHFNSFLSTEDTIQQNVILNFTSGGNHYYYWVQNVAQLSNAELFCPQSEVCPPGANNATESNVITYETNIWNFSGGLGTFSQSSISGANGSSQGDYYASSAGANEAGNGILLAYPTTVYLKVNSVLNSLGEPVVQFLYNDGVGGWQNFDSVIFLSKASTMQGYVVDGHKYNPYGIFFDAEVVFGGLGDGLDSFNVMSDVRPQLEFWNGHNYQMVENAFNFGSDTAESIAGVTNTASWYSDNGTLYGEMEGGAGVLGSLWNQTEVSIATITSTISSGTLSVTNKGVSNPYPAQYSFIGGQATVTLFPGNYVFKVYSTSGALESSFTANLYPGDTYKFNS